MLPAAVLDPRAVPAPPHSTAVVHLHHEAEVLKARAPSSDAASRSLFHSDWRRSQGRLQQAEGLVRQLKGRAAEPSSSPSRSPTKAGYEARTMPSSLGPDKVRFALGGTGNGRDFHHTPRHSQLDAERLAARLRAESRADCLRQEARWSVSRSVQPFCAMRTATQTFRPFEPIEGANVLG